MKCVASSSICNTGFPLIYIKLMYALAMNQVFSAPMMTRYLLDAVLPLWYGSQVDMRYSNFSRVLGATALVPAVFSRSHSLVSDCERTVCEAFVVVPWYRITESRRQWCTQVVSLPFEFCFPHIFKSERILVGNYAIPKMIDFVVDKKVVSV